ncbi:MAG TPA: hypothetical protein PK743_10790 [Luteimonas sp.]|nr:hypothetical protein [Luteimonas sp.]HRO26031.1 hypothetical protein [Luteimonas sp.]HRP73106.1 hypothetical protein [Luteimonas sp.]
MSSAYYETGFARAMAEGLDNATAAASMADALLDGKPAGRATGIERLTAFWSSAFVREVPTQAWAQESLRLALARYLAQDEVAVPGLVAHLASQAPEALRWAARHAGLVRRPDSPRWREVEVLAASQPHEFAEFVQVFNVFRQAREERVAEVERVRAPLAGLTPLELLAYASLYAFEHIVPAQLEETAEGIERDTSLQVRWDAIDGVLAWKLATCDARDFQLDDAIIGRSLRAHLAPFLLPSSQEPPRRDLYAVFSALVGAQVELDEFDSRSADAFSYDDSICFVLRGSTLEIEEVDAEANRHWRLGEEKRLRLHGYWLYRGMHALVESPELLARVAPANLEANLQALAKAMAAWLCLQEVYGIEARVDTGSAAQVDVFNALMSIELMTAFYIEDFIRPFRDALQHSGHPWLALGTLAMSGFAQGENRLPLTWSEKAAKIARIMPWTATRDRPQGHPRAAEAILDFWTSDWEAMAASLRAGETDKCPRLQELPILKLGHHLFQLPWMQAMQDNRVAVINNLRRLGARRAQAREETRRIEQRLGDLFAGRGFKVLVGHALPVAPDPDAQVEEIDLLCARDGCLLVLELKSTFVRRSQKEAWFHRTSTLRKAGLQLRRKVAAVRRALVFDDALRSALGLDADDGPPEVTGWIVDTSIECDHQRFNGFLKVSLEEVLIALRDERRWLNDPDGLFGPSGGRKGAESRDGGCTVVDSLYPEGFSAGRFIGAVESGAVWADSAGSSRLASAQ